MKMLFKKQEYASKQLCPVHCYLITNVIFEVIDNQNVHIVAIYVYIYTYRLFVIVNGTWGVWGAWSTCSKTCNNGTRTRYRSCDNPAPAHGGADCLGKNLEMTSCYIIPCPGMNKIE